MNYNGGYPSSCFEVQLKILYHKLLEAKIFDRLNTVKWQNKYNEITASVITEGLKETSNDNKISLSHGNKSLFLIWRYHILQNLDKNLYFISDLWYISPSLVPRVKNIIILTCHKYINAPLK